MSLLPKSIHRCRRYPTKFNSGRDIPRTPAAATVPKERTRVLERLFELFDGNDPEEEVRQLTQEDDYF